MLVFHLPPALLNVEWDEFVSAPLIDMLGCNYIIIFSVEDATRFLLQHYVTIAT